MISLFQVSARVQAAETGLERMAALLTQLAASGLLPDTFIDKIEDARAEMERLRGDFIPEVFLLLLDSLKIFNFYTIKLKICLLVNVE